MVDESWSGDEYAANAGTDSVRVISSRAIGKWLPATIASQIDDDRCTAPGAGACRGDESADEAVGAVAHAFDSRYEMGTSAVSDAGGDAAAPTYMDETAGARGGDVIMGTLGSVGNDTRSTPGVTPLVAGTIGAFGGDPERGVGQ